MSTRKLKNRWTAGLLGIVTMAALCSMPTKAESACFGPSPEKATLAALQAMSTPEFGSDEGCFDLLESLEEDPFNTVRLVNTCGFDIEARDSVDCTEEEACETYLFVSGEPRLLELRGAEEVVTDFSKNPEPERQMEITWSHDGVRGQIVLWSRYDYGYPFAPPCDDVRTCQMAPGNTGRALSPLGLILLLAIALFGWRRRRQERGPTRAASRFIA